MKKKFFEQKKVVEASCYKHSKYIFSDSPDLAVCPWGYTEIQPNCNHCTWFTVKKVAIKKRPVTTEQEIALDDIASIAEQYMISDRANNAIPIEANPIHLRED